MVDETLDWMNENLEANKEDYDKKQKEVEQVANPIMRNMYSGGAGGEGGDDFGVGFGDARRVVITLLIISPCL
jgi:hypothetical protein